MNRLMMILVLLSPLQAQAAKEYGDVVPDRIGTVIDGDSFKVDIYDWPAIIGKGVTIRINDIDTPELRGKCKVEKDLAREAKQFTVKERRNARKVELKNLKRGKYFRIIADVFVDGSSLGRKLLRHGLARKYGDKYIRWCK